MIDPWTFDLAEEFSAPDGEYKIKYENVHEMAQGSPLTGECYLWKKGKKILINKNCAGPPVWSKDSRYFVVPIWKKLFLKGLWQKIAMVDIEKENIKYSKSNYEVLYLIKFENGTLELINSPVFQPKAINFNIQEIEFENEERLKFIHQY